MKPKTTKIIFWTLTALLCLANLFAGISELFPSQKTFEIFALLGYPAYFTYILGTGKVFGSIAIFQNKYKTIKEWAFAGFSIDYMSASLSFILSKKGVLGAVVPLIFLAVLALTYYFWKKVGKISQT